MNIYSFFINSSVISCVAMGKLVQYSYLMFFFTGILCETMENIPVDCPEYCDCDIFKNLNRAFCQDQNLIEIDLGIPKGVQILDISFNHIKELGDRVFMEHALTELKLLNMSHNKVSHIHFNSFEGMKRLKTLDLSYNAIEYFTENWFTSLSSLQELYLRENKLKSINKQPLINIESLEVLDLSNCGIIHLNNDIFSMLPKLRHLDISGNYLTNLKVDVIKPLSNLTDFKVSNNNFMCKDRSFTVIKKYAKEKNISYIDPCTIQSAKAIFEINDKPMKFQKLMAEEDMFETPITESVEKNRWLNNNEGDALCNCDINIANNRTEPIPKSLLMNIIEYSPWLLIILSFFYGFFIGMIFLCAANLLINKHRVHNSTRKQDDEDDPQPIYANASASAFPSRQNRKISSLRQLLALNKIKKITSISPDDDVLMMNEFIPNSTPMQPRKDYGNFTIN